MRLTLVYLGVAIVIVGALLATHHYSTTSKTQAAPPIRISATPSPLPCASSTDDGGSAMLSLPDVWPGYVSGGKQPHRYLVAPASCGQRYQTLTGEHVTVPLCDLDFPWTSGASLQPLLSVMGATDLQVMTLILGENSERVTESVLGFPAFSLAHTILDNAAACGGHETGSTWTVPSATGDILIAPIAQTSTVVAVQFDTTKISPTRQAQILARAVALSSKPA